MRRLLQALLLALLLVGSLTGCSHDAAPRTADPPDPSPSIRTYTAIPMPPDPPASGRLIADMRQSSRDAAMGRMEVWIDNDTEADLTPMRIRYLDQRFEGPLPGTRLRLSPSRSERGFPLYLPTRPACGSTARSGTVEITYPAGAEERTVTLEVHDPTDVVGRYVRARCQEISVAEVAELAWADTVVDGPVGFGDDATLTLVISPTGVADREITVDTVSGTPVLAAVGAPYWTVDRVVRGDDPTTRIDLPLKPNRCDPHAFLESGGATAFRVKLHLDGRPAELILRMSQAGAAAAIDYAERSCGLGG